MPPGFKGVEGRESKAAEIIIKESGVNAKAAPFVKSAIPEAAGPHAYQAPRESGLEGFLEIGERRVPFDLKDNSNLRRYFEERQNYERLKPEPVLGLTKMVEIQPSFAGRVFNGIKFWAHRILEFIGSKLGGGMAGPMMIFGFLLGPNGKNGGGAKSPINLKTVNDFQQKLRDFIVSGGKEGYFRNSPTSPLENIATVYLTFDVNSSEPILSSNRTEGAMPIHAYRDSRNFIFMDPPSLEIIRGMLDKYPLSEQQRSVLYALTRLQGSPLQIEAKPESNASEPSEQVLPQVLPHQVEAARQFFQYQGGLPMAGMFTFMISGNFLTVKTGVSMDLMKGTMYLSNTGSVAGISIGRSDAYSPRGTQYQKGVLEGTPVDIVTDATGNIYHYELNSHTKLNSKQDALLQAMVNHPKSREAAKKVLEDHPYTVDFIMGRGMALIARSFEATMGRADKGRFEIQIFKDGAGYRFVNASVPGKPSKEMPLGIISVDYELGPKHPQRSWETQAGKFQYQLLQGTLPHEVLEYLNFVQAKMTSSSD